MFTLKICIFLRFCYTPNMTLKKRYNFYCLNLFTKIIVNYVNATHESEDVKLSASCQAS